VQGVGGEDGVGKVQSLQEGLEPGDLVGGVLDVGLAQDAAAGVVHRREQVHRAVPWWPLPRRVLPSNATARCAGAAPVTAGWVTVVAAGRPAREMMERIGHSSTAAALRFQHVMKDRDKAIAAGLDRLAQAADILTGNDNNDNTADSSGTQMARRRPKRTA